MPGGEYEPKDSRDVTRKPNAPGKPTGWRGKEGAPPQERGELEPNDSRDVTRHPNAPGEPSGWRETEDPEQAETGEAGKAGEDADERQRRARAETRPPVGVPQEGRPFTAEEAAQQPPHRRD